MAARLMLRRRALAPLAVVVLGGAMTLAPRAVHAEAPGSEHSRKPIYDDFKLPPTTESPITAPTSLDGPVGGRERGPSPTDRLAVQIGKIRKVVYGYALHAEDAVNNTMDKAFHLEQSFTNTIASLAPPRESGEKLMPGVIYVLVAAMAGSIVTRNRNVLLRATMPLALGIGAGWVVLPITMTNISNLTWKYEQRFPAVADAHIGIRDGIQKSWGFAKAHTRGSVQYIDDKVTDARETVEGWVKKGK